VRGRRVLDKVVPGLCLQSKDENHAIQVRIPNPDTTRGIMVREGSLVQITRGRAAGSNPRL